MITVELSSLKPGQKGRVARVTGDAAVRKRLVDMGITSGTEVELLRVAPLGDPVEVRVKGYCLSLRKEEAKSVKVEIISEGNRAR